jgi:isopentenyldiphosphate isomerase
MDECIELLDKNGQPNGTRCLKSLAHQKGFFHATVHVWLYTPKGDVLVQKRNANKDAFPSLWDVSVAGHIAFGETPTLAAKREVLEEIGVHIRETNLISIGKSTRKISHAPDFIDWELHHLFLYECPDKTVKTSLQKEEVDAIRWTKIDELAEQIKKPKHSKNYVPHGPAYYEKIFRALRKKTKVGLGLSKKTRS